ncbi:unnamed protein product [Allacma fusca]|uniref:Uncharacterized protein n=1 Tax=Allacma fusca TaxID=39272 RepID=A0A8J2PMT3_9HEXA|nr:unnamed protein product [Allacma fusca]
MGNNVKILVPFNAKTRESGAQESTQRILKNIFGNYVASQLNWKGAIRKKLTPKTGIQKFPRVVKLKVAFN